jgi:hypothetical protein
MSWPSATLLRVHRRSVMCKHCGNTSVLNLRPSDSLFLAAA